MDGPNGSPRMQRPHHRVSGVVGLSCSGRARRGWLGVTCPSVYTLVSPRTEPITPRSCSQIEPKLRLAAFFIDPVVGMTGFVGQVGIRPFFPLPQIDSAYGLGTGDAKGCETVQDRSTDLDFRDLTVEVTRREALNKQLHTMHSLPGRVFAQQCPERVRFSAASTVVPSQLPPQCAAQIF